MIFPVVVSIYHVPAKCKHDHQETITLSALESLKFCWEGDYLV